MFKKIALALMLMTLSSTVHAAQNFEELFFSELKKETFETLRAVNLSKSSKIDRLATILKENLAILQVGRSVLGQPWRKISTDEKREYIRAFEKWIGITIAERLVSMDIKKDLIIEKVYKGQNSIVVVRTVTENVVTGGDITLDWYIKTIKGEPKLIDVAVSNVSMVATQRSEVLSLYGNKGLKGVIEEMTLQAKEQ